MANILTVDQAANALRVPNTDPRLIDLLPQVDEFIKRATGRDWAQDTSKFQVAISAATQLLVMWYDNPSMIGNDGSLPFGLTAALTMLEAEALKYRRYEFRGIHGAGYIALPGARAGDQVISLVGTYGVSGDQSANFESALRYPDSFLQISTDDLYWNFYVVILKNPADDVLP